MNAGKDLHRFDLPKSFGRKVCKPKKGEENATIAF
jgi:hypothetical protein